jgi:hypothetical protein
VAAIVQPA